MSTLSTTVRSILSPLSLLHLVDLTISLYFNNIRMLAWKHKTIMEILLIRTHKIALLFLEILSVFYLDIYNINILIYVYFIKNM